ncbi:MAG: GAF domain-containing protein, partial [Acetobacteraceae bacterium]|nr:GAF domain-containing protein [Acetobacteraceae bacterium]
MSGPRRLLARLRETLARGAAPLPHLVAIIAGEMTADVCSVYAMRPGDILELVATFGLNPDAVGHTRLRVGEGIVGLCAATGSVLNLPDAQNHPGFAYRPETGEEPFASLIAVPIRRAGHTVGVLVVQNRLPRLYEADEVEVLETVAMLLAEVLIAAGASGGAEEGVASTLPRVFTGISIAGGIAIGPVVLHGRRLRSGRLLADDPETELARLNQAAEQMQRRLDELIAAGLPEGDAPREVLEAYRLIAADAGWLRRMGVAIQSGLSAEAAVQRVAGELRDRMRRVADPYLRERMADLEDMAGRLLDELDGEPVASPEARGAILLARRIGPAELLDWHARGIAGLVIEEASAGGHAAIMARAL